VRRTGFPFAAGAKLVRETLYLQPSAYFTSVLDIRDWLRLGVPLWVFLSLSANVNSCLTSHFGILSPRSRGFGNYFSPTTEPDAVFRIPHYRPLVACGCPMRK
jgi:hypothetical protein